MRKDLTVSNRKFAILIISITALVFLAGAAYQHFHFEQRLKPAAPIEPRCSTAGDPCIQIDLDNRVSYKLNDFRFMPKKCIMFISLPDRKQHKFCGNYEMKWIGPNIQSRAI